MLKEIAFTQSKLNKRELLVEFQIVAEKHQKPTVILFDHFHF